MSPCFPNKPYSPGSTTRSRKKFFSTHQTGMVQSVRPR